MKKQFFKKSVVLLFALLMMLALVPTMVLAGGAADPTYAGPKPATGNLLVHKYAVGSTADVGEAGDGTEITDTDFFTGKTPLEGIEFTAIMVNPQRDASNGSFVYPDDPNDAYYATAEATTGNTAITVATTSAGLAAFNNLPQGVYLVKESKSTDANGVTYAPVAPFLVQVPMTNPTGDGWLEDVHVYPKNLDMTPEKTADGAGESGKDPATDKTINWAINVQVPSDLDNTKIIRITDNIDPLLAFNDDVVVSAIATKDAASGTVLTATTHYTVDFDEGTNKLVVNLTEAGIAHLKTLFAAQPYLRVAFSTDLTDDALGLIIGNGAEYEFGNDEDNLIKTELDKDDPEAPKAYTGAIKVNKEDPEGTVLVGAVFKVASSLENAKAGVFLKDVSGNDIVGTTGSDGVAILKGIPYGGKGEAANDETIHGAKKYYLVEVKAPEGFNLLDEPVEVGFSYEKVETPAGSGVYMNYFNNGATFTVVNSKGFTLPGTGSTGIVLSTILGIALLAVVIVLVARRKTRKSNEA